MRDEDIAKDPETDRIAHEHARRRAAWLLALWGLAAVLLYLGRGVLNDPFYRPVAAPTVAILLLLGAAATWRGARARRGVDRRRKDRRGRA